jgi:serine/threonine-protein kinase HipA
MSNGKTISVSVLYNGRRAGVLEKSKGHYRFIYDEAYISTAGSRPISITMPFLKSVYESDTLFPVFINMLSEGANKRIQCRMLKIDENDYFGLLIATAKEDSIGPITIKTINEPS